MSDLQNGQEPPSNQPPGSPVSSTPGAAWPPPPTSQITPSYSSSPTYYYVPPAFSARWAAGCLVAFAILDLITAGGEFMVVGHNLDIGTGVVVAGLDFLQFLFFFPCAIFFLIWMHRVCSNALAFGAQNIPISPGWAVGYFFVPILFFFRPYQAMRDAWRASLPGLDLREDPEGWRRVQPAPLVVGWWWAYWLFYNVSSAGYLVLSFSGHNIQGTSIPPMLDLLHAGLDAVAIRFVLSFSSRQEAAYRRLAAVESHV